MTKNKSEKKNYDRLRGICKTIPMLRNKREPTAQLIVCSYNVAKKLVIHFERVRYQQSEDILYNLGVVIDAHLIRGVTLAGAIAGMCLPYSETTIKRRLYDIFFPAFDQLLKE